MKDVMKLRAHHMYCFPFLNQDLSARGPAFLEMEAKVRQTMRLDTGKTLELISGVDEVCLACPLRAGDRCESPEGNEEEVRKWDALVLRGLGLEAGAVISVERFRDIAKEQSPIPLCRRCRWRESCEVATGQSPA